MLLMEEHEDLSIIPKYLVEQQIFHFIILKADTQLLILNALKQEKKVSKLCICNRKLTVHSENRFASDVYFN